MGRAPCCDKANVKKGPWSPEEDAKLRAFIEQNGTGGNWITLPMKAGLKRCGKSCRLRWINYLRPGIKRGGFSEEEEKLIYKLHASFGSRWSLIAAQLPGRTDNDIKNYWNTRLKRKLCDKEEISCGPKEIEPQDILPLSCNAMPDLQSSAELPVEELLLRIENSLQSCISAPSPGESSCSTDRSPPHSHCHFKPAEFPGDFFPPTYNSIAGDQQYRPFFQRMPAVDVADCFGRNLNVKEESGLFESNWWASFSLPPSNGWAWPNRI